MPWPRKEAQSLFPSLDEGGKVLPVPSAIEQSRAVDETGARGRLRERALSFCREHVAPAACGDHCRDRAELGGFEIEMCEGLGERSRVEPF